MRTLELVIDGRRYVRAKVAARNARVSQNAVGQACRYRLRTKRLGRLWFVDEQSLAEYLQRKSESNGMTWEAWRQLRQRKCRQARAERRMMSGMSTAPGDNKLAIPSIRDNREFQQ